MPSRIPSACAAACVRTFLALSESSDASMVMYFSPLILIPFAMTPLGSLLSLKESAMALRSESETWWLVSMPLHRCHKSPWQSSSLSMGKGCMRLTYGEARGRGPDGASGGVADDGFVDVARADEATDRSIKATAKVS